MILEQYVQAGRGLLAIHALISAGKDWPWFKDAVGTKFLDHPPIQNAKVILQENGKAKTSRISWSQNGEWYNFTQPCRTGIELISSVKTSYQGEKMGNPHVISWCRKSGDGQVIYVSMGHEAALYTDAKNSFVVHIFDCLQGVLFPLGSHKLKKY